MIFKNIVTGAKALLNATKTNPHIALAGAAVVGVVTVAVSAYNSGVKAKHMLDEAEFKKITNDEGSLTRKEKAKIIAKCSWVTAVLVIFTGAAIITGTYQAHKSIKKLTVAYTTTAAMLEAHQQAELVKLGKDVADDIREKVVEETELPEKNKWNTIREKHNKNEDLWYDSFTAHYFYATEDRVNYAFRELYNYMRIDNGCASLADLYGLLEWDDIYPTFANDWGFSMEETLNGCMYADQIPYRINTKKAKDGSLCFVLDYYAHPLDGDDTPYTM